MRFLYRCRFRVIDLYACTSCDIVTNPFAAHHSMLIDFKARI